MLKFKRSMIVALAALGLFPASSSMAAVSLAITDNDASPAQAIVAPGGVLNVSVKLLSTSLAAADSVIALSYQLQATGPGNGVFTLISRDTVGAPANGFTDFTATNLAILDNTLAKNFPARLNPINFNGDPNKGDLGATLADLTSPISNTDPGGAATGPDFNPALVANYGLSIAANAPAGVYTLSIVPITYSSYNTQTQVISDGTLSNTPGASPIQQSFQVTVAPEPSSALLVGMGLSALGLRRRRRSLSN